MTSTWLLLVLFFALGCGAGALFFGGLKRTVALVLGEGPAWAIAAVYVLRFAVVLVILFWAAQFGAGPLLAATAGFTAAGLAALWRERRLA